MKYGRIVHIGYSRGTNERREINLGDIFECMAIENVYRKLGICENDILSIYQHNLEDYDGEYVVLPINIYAQKINYSSRVLPVFLGITYGGQNEMSEQEIDLLKRFSPIGCRDERTLRNLLHRNVDAYLNGCLVATFPKRVQNLPTQDTVIFADPQKEILPYIPSNLKKKYRFIYHDLYVTPEELSEDGNLITYGEKFLDIYIKEAKLVITSRFHAAVLCLALGIPCILTMENFYYKYTWIKKYIPLYEPKDFEKIDWNPPAIVISEEEKALMLQIACKRLKQTYEKYYDMCTLSEVRENYDIKEFDDIFYGNDAIAYIKRNWKTDEKIQYAFWGITLVTKKLYDFIQANYPNAKLCKVYDFKVREQFMGVKPEHFDNIDRNNNCFIFVTSQSAVNAAKEKFAQVGKATNEFFLCERHLLREEDFLEFEQKL